MKFFCLATATGGNNKSLPLFLRYSQQRRPPLDCQTGPMFIIKSTIRQGASQYLCSNYSCRVAYLNTVLLVCTQAVGGGFIAVASGFFYQYL